MKRDKSLADGRVHLEERPSSEPADTPKKTFAFWFFLSFFSRTRIFGFVRGPQPPLRLDNSSARSCGEHLSSAA